MATPDERTKILAMLEEGKITAEEAARLLKALSKGKSESRSVATSGESKWMRIRVRDTASGKTSVNVNVPLSLVNVGLKLGAQFVPDIDGVDLDEIDEALKSGLTGKIVDVYDEEEGEHVEIYIE